MFKITNNKVFISRGQEAVYSRNVCLNDDYATPYVVTDRGEGLEPKISFTVKKSIYDSDNKMMFRLIGSLPDTIRTFESSVVINAQSEEDQVTYDFLVDGEFKPIITDDNKADLYKHLIMYTDSSGDYNFIFIKEITDDEYSEYAFLIEVVLYTDLTNDMEPGSYYYEISVNDYDEDDVFQGNKHILLDPTEFEIGGSLGER